MDDSLGVKEVNGNRDFCNIKFGHFLRQHRLEGISKSNQLQNIEKLCNSLKKKDTNRESLPAS
jgi:hypothetical protein